MGFTNRWTSIVALVLVATLIIPSPYAIPSSFQSQSSQFSKSSQIQSVLTQIHELSSLIHNVSLIPSIPNAYAQSPYELQTNGNDCTAIGGSWNSPDCTLTSSILTLNSGDSLTIDTGVTLVINEVGTNCPCGGINNNGGDIENYGTIDEETGAPLNNPYPINNGGTIENYGSIIMSSSSPLFNGGTITNSGTITMSDNNYVKNTGTITNNSGGMITINYVVDNLGMIFNNGGTISGTGFINSKVESVGNSGSFTIPVRVTENELPSFGLNFPIQIDGEVTISAGTFFIINSGASVTVTSNAILNNAGTIDNRGTINVQNIPNGCGDCGKPGTIINSGTLIHHFPTASFSNSGTFSNSGSVELGGTITNSVSLDQLGYPPNTIFNVSDVLLTINPSVTLTIPTGYTIVDSGTIDNNGNIINNAGGTISGNGPGEIQSLLESITNNGSITSIVLIPANDSPPSNYILSFTAIVPQGVTLTIGTGTTLTINSGEKLNNQGITTINSGGIVINNGIIDNSGAQLINNLSGTLTNNGYIDDDCASIFTDNGSFSGPIPILFCTYQTVTSAAQPTANIVFGTSAGTFSSLTGISQSSLSTQPPSGSYPYGFFSWTITGLGVGLSSDVCMTYPTDPGTVYEKLIGTTWYQIPVTEITNSDGSVRVCMHLTDGAPGEDADQTANGQITDPGGMVAMTTLSVKKSVITSLNSLSAATHDDKQDLSEAIKQVTQSTDSSLWNIDGIHLVVKKGDQVFDHEKQAVQQLMDIVKGNKETATGFNSMVENDITILVGVDKTIATTAIADANTAANGLTGNHAKDVQNDIAQAQKEMSQASGETSKGHFDAAIDHYKNAWKHAEDAISDAQHH